MDRSRYNGKQDNVSTTNLPTLAPNGLDRRSIARKVESIKAELDQLQQMALAGPVFQEENVEIARKYTMFYEIAHSLQSHIQQQKDLCLNAIKLVADIFTTVDDEIRLKYKSELQVLQVAFEELTAAGSLLKPPSMSEFNPSRSSEQLNTDLNSSSNPKRPLPTNIDPRTIARPKNQRVDIPPNAKYTIASNGQRIEATSTTFEPRTYEQLNHVLNPATSTGTMARHVTSPPVQVPQGLPGHSSPTLEPDQPKALIALGRPDVPLDFSKSQANQSKKANAGIQSLFNLHHGDVVCSITSSGQDANFIYTGGLGCVKLWDRSKGVSCAALSLESMDNYIRACRISPDGKTLVVGGESDKIVLWDISQPTPASLACFVASSTAVYAMTFSPDSRHLFTCGSGGDILVWDLPTRKRIRTLQGHNLGVTCIDITPDGRKLVSGGLDKTVRLWDLVSYTEIARCNLSSPIFSLGLGCFNTPFNENDACVIAGAESSLISVLPLRELIKNDPKLANTHETFPGHATCVISLKFSPDRRHFVSTGKEGLIMGWKLSSSGPAIEKLFVHQESASVLSCDISRNGKYLITGSGSKFATVYHLQW
ncbi:Transducin-like enhancer protein 2 [Entomophthora muscae]|uniref:Transducin-like enhancer protein 2 n=1 Tax=Entomophthora muscae TaxID=34485 RepID=A0ACC2RGT3_9FUNG|nr:Transducin-like enhancer protein 2 [Entomophthora muscae]